MTGSFPAPRYPRFKQVSKDELRRKIASLVGRAPLKGMGDQPHAPRYDIKPGEKVLVITLTEFDPEVVEGYLRAIKDRGALVVLLAIDSTPDGPPVLAGVREADVFLPF